MAFRLRTRQRLFFKGSCDICEMKVPMIFKRLLRGTTACLRTGDGLTWQYRKKQNILIYLILYIYIGQWRSLSFYWLIPLIYIKIYYIYVSFVLLTVVSCSIGRQAAVNGAMASQHQRAEKKQWTCPFWPVSLCYIDRNVATLLNMTFSNI